MAVEPIITVPSVGTEEDAVDVKIRVIRNAEEEGSVTNEMVADLFTALKSHLETKITAVKTTGNNTATDLSALSARLDTLISGNVSEAIDNYNEVIAFLEGVKDTDTLAGKLVEINEDIDILQNNVEEIEQENQQHNKEIAALQNSMDTAVEHIDNLEQDVAGQGRRLEKVETALDSANDLLEDVIIESGEDYIDITRKYKLAYGDTKRRPDVVSSFPMAEAPGRGSAGQAGAISCDDMAALEKASAVADRFDGAHVVSNVTFEASDTAVGYKVPRFRPDGQQDLIVNPAEILGLGFPFPMASAEQAGAVTAGQVVAWDEKHKEAFIELWDSACSSNGRYNPETGFFELNGLTDIPFLEAKMIYNAGIDQGSSSYKYYNMPIRTTIPGTHHNWTSTSLTYAGCRNLQVVSTAPNIGSSTFYDCVNLHTILSKVTSISGGNYFHNCSNLRDVEFELSAATAVTYFDFGSCPLLSLKTVQSLSKGATQTQTYRITFHKDVYAKLTGNTENAACAALTDEERAQWLAAAEAILAKKISIASA